MKKVIILLSLFLGVFMQASNQPLEFYEINQVKIPVISEESSLLPIDSIRLIFIGGGSINDGEKLGLARLSASLLNEGTKELGSNQFAQALEQKAIDLSANTGTETLDIELNYLKDEQKSAIDFLGQLLASPNLKEDTLKKIKTLSASALLTKKADFDYIANRQLLSILFKNTPLANPALGTIKSIENIHLEDIKNYLKENLVLSRLVIVMGGDMDTQKTLKQLKPILAKLSVGEKSKTHHYEANPKPQEKITYKDTEQAYIYFGSPFKIDDLQKESYKAKVMSFILGSSGLGSRLMEEIRVKRGLAYSAYLRIATGNIASYTLGYLQTQLQNQDESIQLVKKVVADFVKNGATQAELDGAKKFLLGSEPLRNETLSNRIATKFYNFYLGLPLDFDKTQLKQIQSLTLDELNSYIKSHTEINALSFSIVTKKEAK